MSIPHRIDLFLRAPLAVPEQKDGDRDQGDAHQEASATCTTPSLPDLDLLGSARVACGHRGAIGGVDRHLRRRTLHTIVAEFATPHAVLLGTVLRHSPFLLLRRGSRKIIRIHRCSVWAARSGDRRKKRPCGSDNPSSVNLDGASFICVNAARGLEVTWEIALGALRSLARHSSAIRGSCGPGSFYSSQLWSACS